MKFIDLTSNMRSMLTALNSTNYLTTEVLGIACVPKLNPTVAAHVLIEMRAKGVIYSTQKPDNQRFALWGCTEYGRAVFMGRPDTDVQPAPVQQAACAAPVALVPKRFILGSPGGTLTVLNVSRDAALAEAQSKATQSPGCEYRVYEQIATAHMPVPQAQITLL